MKKQNKVLKKINNYPAMHPFKTCFYVLIFATIISGLFSYFVVIPLISKPSFTIYQEFCENETGEYDGYKCSNGGNSFPPYFDELGVENYTLRNGLFCSKIHDTWNEQTCTLKEVDEINVSAIGVKNCFCFNNTGNCRCQNDIVSVPKFYIQENPEWLDTNCECLEGEYRECLSGSINPPCYNKIEYHNCKWVECSKYKCGENYIVEVER